MDSYIPYFNVSQNNTGSATQVLYHYDVWLRPSLYPYVMKQFKLPYKIKQFIEGNILLSNKELFENSFGFYKVKVTTPKQILNPLLPCRRPKNNGAGVGSSTVLYPEGSWIGTYYSEEIKPVGRLSNTATNLKLFQVICLRLTTYLETTLVSFSI